MTAMVRLTIQDLVVSPTKGSMPGQTEIVGWEWLAQSLNGWTPASLSHFWLAITWLIKIISFHSCEPAQQNRQGTLGSYLTFKMETVISTEQCHTHRHLQAVIIHPDSGCTGVNYSHVTSHTCFCCACWTLSPQQFASTDNSPDLTTFNKCY